MCFCTLTQQHERWPTTTLYSSNLFQRHWWDVFKQTTSMVLNAFYTASANKTEWLLLRKLKENTAHLYSSQSNAKCRHSEVPRHWMQNKRGGTRCIWGRAVCVLTLFWWRYYGILPLQITSKWPVFWSGSVILVIKLSTSPILVVTLLCDQGSQ